MVKNLDIAFQLADLIGGPDENYEWLCSVSYSPAPNEEWWGEGGGWGGGRGWGGGEGPFGTCPLIKKTV